jgi:heat shock protein HspQ
MKMFIERLFDLSIVKWVINKNRKHHREKPMYMLVVTNEGDSYLFTKNQVAEARERALRNPEDSLTSADYIT